MKFLHYALLALLTLTYTSCKKDQLKTTKIETNYFYRLAIVDLDQATTYSKVATTALVVEVIGSASKDDDDCKEHPNSARCKTLPVILEYFDVYKKDSDIHVTWKPSVEYNLHSYAIERSIDGLNFETVAIVWPAGPGSVYDIKDTYKK